MADPEVDQIGIMAYVAYFLKFKPIRSAAEKVIFSSLPQNVSVGQEVSGSDLRFKGTIMFITIFKIYGNYYRKMELYHNQLK